MPTRLTNKPSSYTFDSGARHGANMQAGYIFIDSDISGNNITDVTGNGNTIVKDAGASTEATDAVHGKCFRSDGANGASFDPPGDGLGGTGWDAWTNHTIVTLFKVEVNSPSAVEILHELIHSTKSQDAMLAQWNTNDNAFARFESQTESTQDIQITDAIINNAGEWGTFATVCDATAGEFRLYVIIDGDATQIGTLANAGTLGTPDDTDVFRIAKSWTGLVEASFVFDKAFSTADVEDFHENPYRELGVVGISASGPSSTTLGATETYSTEGLTNPITATYNGLACTVDNTAHPSVDVTFPDFSDITLTDTEFGVNHELLFQDGTNQTSLQVTIQKDAAHFQVTYASSAPEDSILENDQNVSFGDIILVRDIDGTITQLNDDSTLLFNANNYDFEYQVWDVSDALWSNITPNSSDATPLPTAAANASAINIIGPDLSIANANASGVILSAFALEVANAQATALVLEESDQTFWDVSPSEDRILKLRWAEVRAIASQDASAKLNYWIDLSKFLGEATISSVTVTVLNAAVGEVTIENERTNTLAVTDLESITYPARTLVGFTFSGGLAKKQYKVNISCTTNSNEVMTGDVWITVNS